MSYPQSEKKCKNCIYYREVSKPHVGDCLLQPPQIVVIDQDVYSFYPRVRSDRFCKDGCWQKRSEITDTTELYYIEDGSRYSWLEELELSQRQKEQLKK